MKSHSHLPRSNQALLAIYDIHLKPHEKSENKIPVYWIVVGSITEGLINSFSVLASTKVSVSCFFLPTELHRQKCSARVRPIAEWLIRWFSTSAPVIVFSFLHCHFVGPILWDCWLFNNFLYLWWINVSYLFRYWKVLFYLGTWFTWAIPH